MDAKSVINIVRSSQRPWLVFLFPLAVVVIAIGTIFALLPVAVKFIDRDIAMVIIVAAVSILTSVSASTATIMAFIFGERASKKTAETPEKGD